MRNGHQATEERDGVDVAKAAQRLAAGAALAKQATK
jgi:hypothetical protein